MRNRNFCLTAGFPTAIVALFLSRERAGKLSPSPMMRLPAQHIHQSKLGDTMTTFAELFATIEAKGQEFMRDNRHRMRNAYMACKNASRTTDWRVTDDEAFAGIDHMIAKLALEAGYLNNAPAYPNAPPPPQRPAPPLLRPATPAPAVHPLATDIEKALAGNLAAELGVNPDTATDLPSGGKRPTVPRSFA